jgi:LPS O-antigen subunit length determinant protein (WzzB/FepE family)
MTDNNTQNFDDDVDFTVIFLALWDKKILIASISSIAAIFSVLYSLSLPDIYTSNALLAPASSEDSMSSKLGGYSALAGMAGINLPSDNGSKTPEAIERIKSYDFFVNEFLPNIKFENLIAAKDWIKESNSIVYDSKAFDLKTPRSSKQEAYLTYTGMLRISEDKNTSFVYMSIDHVSPYIAEKWLKLIIYNINNHMREIDKTVAENSIIFLKKSSQETYLSDIKVAIFKLIENQIQTLTLVESTEDYIFKSIVSPIAPEKKSRPSRSIICIIGTFVGLIMGIVISLVLHYFNFKKI